MISIVEPKDYIIKLLGKQQMNQHERYRLMKYVLRVCYDNVVLLHNVVTGQLVALDRDEAELIRQLPIVSEPIMEALVAGYYLVPENFNEYQQVINLRSIAQRLNDYQRPKAITHYTIFPTTACNARCYYCFEQGVKATTMTEETANDVIEFIAANCGEEKKVRISWFGGEPTVAAHRIDQISIGLQKKGIQYQSDITTNGYLFDEEMISRSVELWKLSKVMICVDGTEAKYNETKAYVNVRDNPYQRVMRNIGLLLDRRIHVNLRMNYDLANYEDFSDLITDIKTRHFSNDFLYVRVHPVIGVYADNKGNVMHGDEDWFSHKTVELNDIARKEGYHNIAKILPHLNIMGCQANNRHSVTITAQGNLVRCPEQFSDNQIIGNIHVGITNDSLEQAWKIIGDYKRCRNCPLFPRCMKLEQCAIGDYCYSYLELLSQYQTVIKQIFSESVLLFKEEV